MNNNKPKWIKYTLTILLWIEGPEKTKHSLKRRNPKCKTKKSPNKQTKKSYVSCVTRVPEQNQKLKYINK